MIATHSSTEFELKFEVAPAQLGGLRRALERGAVSVCRLLSIYFDTEDERLAMAGVTIRLRKEGRRWVQTAKAITSDPVRRSEHNADVATPRGGGSPRLDLARHDGTALAPAICAALGCADAQREAMLVERFRVDVSRTSRLTRSGAASIELALDRGKVHVGLRSMPFCELEMEWKSGSPAALIRLATLWCERHALWLSIVSKAGRGVRLLHAETRGNPVTATPPSVGARDGRAAFFVATLQSCLAQILGNAGEVGPGSTGEPAIHQLRIGLRRLQTALRELEDFGPVVDPAWAMTFGQAFRELGEHRDGTTVIPAIRRELTQAGVPHPIRIQEGTATRCPLAIVRAADFQCALLALLALCQPAPPLPTARGKRPHKQLISSISKLLDRLHTHLARDARKFSTFSPRRRHEVRKRLKRFRYLAEFSAPLFGADRVAKYLEDWRGAQDALGAYNDHCVGLAAVESGAASERSAGPARRWLARRLRTIAERCEVALRKAAKSEAFWRA